MQKSFTLWRLPPVLIIQLKRFQFDRTNRRKLNNHIEFPIENLDVFDYLATSRQRSLSGDAAVDLTGGTGTTTSGGASGATASSGASTTIATAITTIADAGACSTTPTEALQGSGSSTALAMSALYGDSLPIPTAIESTTDTSSKENTQPADPHPTTTGAALCTKYDLYSVIHHAGAMGGGHYATTARSLNIHTGPHTPPVTATGADTDTWYCYNDNIVNKVVDTRDISSSSAYVLFYMRQDMRQGDVLSLLRSQLSVPTGIDTVGDMKHELQYNNNSSSIGTINTTIPVLPPQKEEGTMHLTSTVEVPTVPINMKHCSVLPGGQVGDGSEKSRGFTVDRKEQSASQNNSVNDSSTSSNNKVSNSNITGTSNNKVSISNSRNNHTTTSSSDNNSSTSNSSTTATTTVAAAESGCVPS